MSTPKESFTGKKPDVSHLKKFGSSVYVHVTKGSRKKLELTVEVGIFVGYIETPHNYRVYFSNSKMIVMRQGIKFDEGKAMRLSLERELELHVEEELLVPRMSLNMWISHMRRLMKWMKPLKQIHPLEMAESAPRKLTD
jgi:hypothetical protein